MSSETLPGIRICMLGLPNKVPYGDFMARYSIVAPKIFADMASDPKGCANKALPHAGLDPDDFRTGHTKVRLRQKLVISIYIAFYITLFIDVSFGSLLIETSSKTISIGE